MARGLLMLAAMLLPAQAALAGPPYATDDPGVLGLGQIEAIPYLDAVLASGPDTGESGIDANIGIAHGIQIGLIAPLHSFGGGRDRLAIGDVSLTAKLVVADDGGTGPAIALGPALALPTASAGRARAGLDLPLWIGIERGPWSLHGGGGYRLAANRDGGDLPFGGIVARRRIGERLNLGGEAWFEGKRHDGTALAMIGPGIEWQLSNSAALVAAGHAILSHRRENGDFHVYAALVLLP